MRRRLHRSCVLCLSRRRMNPLLRYPIDQVPEFWEWLCYQGAAGNVKIPVEIMEEILEGRKEKDLLLDWVKDAENSTALLLEDEVSPVLVQHVVSRGYASNLTDIELEQIGCDPFLIAYALAKTDCCVVTTEVSKPRRTRHNRHVPDVCRDLSVQCCDPFMLNRSLGFRTSWRGLINSET